MQLARPYAMPALTAFQPSRTVHLSGLGNVSGGPGGPGFGFAEIVGGIIGTVGNAASSIANAFASGAVAGEQTKQANIAAQSATELARLQYEAAMAKQQTLREALPWVGVGVAALGVVYVFTRK